jgi:hypothetical protein
MTAPYTFFADLATEAPIPARGILSQTLSNEGDIEFLLFAFAAGEQLSEHTSARPAIIHLPAPALAAGHDPAIVTDESGHEQGGIGLARAPLTP